MNTCDWCPHEASLRVQDIPGLRTLQLCFCCWMVYAVWPARPHLRPDNCPDLRYPPIETETHRLKDQELVRYIQGEEFIQDVWARLLANMEDRKPDPEAEKRLNEAIAGAKDRFT